MLARINVGLKLFDLSLGAVQSLGRLALLLSSVLQLVPEMIDRFSVFSRLFSPAIPGLKKGTTKTTQRGLESGTANRR
jgi:hypothetical protein